MEALLTKKLFSSPFARIAICFGLIVWGDSIFTPQSPEVVLKKAAVLEETEVFQKPERKRVSSKIKSHEHSQPHAKIDINRASAQELVQLKGIGPVLAARIVEYRNECGSFKTVDDLQNVKGIGPKSIMKLKEQKITVSR